LADTSYGASEIDAQAGSTPAWSGDGGEAQTDYSGVATTEFDQPDEAEASRIAGLGDDADRR
jgi:hypothetical protein